MQELMMLCNIKKGQPIGHQHPILFLTLKDSEVLKNEIMNMQK